MFATGFAFGATATVEVGQTVTLSVTANGTAPLAYQWRKDNTVIAGATNATYVISPVSASSAGNYSVVVSNSAGSTTSNTGTIVVASAVAPAITTQPASRTVTAGQSASFTVAASGTAPLSYQWRKNGTNISGATSATYTIGSVSSGSAGTYSVVVSNSAGSATSANATLTVSASTDSGLVLALGFEEGTGTTTNDASGYGNNGSLRSATWSSAGKYGRSVAFNGRNALVTVNDSASLDLTTGMTIEAWVYPTSLSGAREILHKDPSLFFLRGSTSTRNAPAIDGSFSSSALYGRTSLPLNAWSHVASTYDGSTLRLYVNGTQVASRSQTGAIRTSSGQLSIGGNAVFGRHWQGRIDEVRVYRRALSQSEVQTDMNTPIGTAAAQSIAQPMAMAATAAETTDDAGRLANLSSRMETAAGDGAAIAGFVVDGDGPETILIRGIGPGLGQVGVSGAIVDPVLKVFSGGTQIAENTGWKTSVSEEIRTVTGAAGAFPLSEDGRDCAILGSFAPGAYSVQLSDRNGRGGAGMIELYEIEATGSSRLINGSTRALVGPGSAPLINGSVIGGNSARTLLVRAVGPGLRRFGVERAMARPALSVYSSDGTRIAGNMGWGSNPDSAALVAAAGNRVGAFTLANGSADSALLITLKPGAYTFHVVDANGAGGVVLLELYDATVTSSPAKR